MTTRLTISGGHWALLRSHLFPGDRDEHGAVLRCGVSETSRGLRLLVREVILAEDGVDYVDGNIGYKKLDAGFVLDNAMYFGEDQSVYIAVHCHGGTDSVDFSSTDLNSHALGYPGLLELIGAPVVGALVFAQNAVAGDLWLENGERLQLDELVITDPVRRVLTPRPMADVTVEPEFDRQARLFGSRGQAVLARQKVAVVGLGGAGSLIAQMLAHLGVGEMVLVDPDRIEPTNLSRVVGSSRWDARAWMRGADRHAWLQRLGARWSAKKVTVARRVARRASRSTRTTALFGDVSDPRIAAQLVDCDHIFLAADTATARLVVNAIAHQFLVPITQVGAKVVVDRDSGDVLEVFAVSRLVTPGHGCLKCNGLISPIRLQEEATDREQVKRQRYVDGEDVPAPSVITLNSIATSRAVDEWLMRTVGLADAPMEWMHYDSIAAEMSAVLARKDQVCSQCGEARFARGDAVRLPVRLR